MPAPYNYRINQPDASSYFDAFTAGRKEKLAEEQDVRNTALAKYLPGALQGDKEARAQALAAGNPDQQIALSQHFAQMDATQLAKLKRDQAEVASLAVAATTPEAWAQVNARAKQLNPNAPDIPFEQRDMVIAQAQTVAEQLDQAWKAKTYDLDKSRTEAQIRASDASAAAARAPASQRGNMPIGRPLPSPVQRAEDEDIAAIQTTQTINAQLDGIAEQIQNGTLDLGPVYNALSRGQNYLGASSSGSVAFAEMMSTLEKMRNDSLILNKGVQTEGDAVRAWNALIANVNDPKVVLAQINRIKRLNDIAAEQKKQTITVRRGRNPGTEPFDFEQISPTQGQTPSPAPAEAPSGPVVPKVGERRGDYMFLGGDPADKSRWRKVVP